MIFDLRDSLSHMVKAKFNAAEASGALTFSSTELAIVPVAGIPFQFRFCPALANKPKDNGPRKESAKRLDPFENPIPELLIGSLPRQNPSHILVLNKYPIIPNHFILATKSNKAQTQLLEEDDVAMAYECLKAWEKLGDGQTLAGRLFAFFNSGEHSGASQAHRHIQFLPAEDVKRDVREGEWSLLIDMINEQSNISVVGEPSQVRMPKYNVPFTCFCSKLPPNPSTADLYGIYMKLYEACAASVETFIGANPDRLERHSTEEGNLPISYNLGMTKECMIICPRRSEGKMISRDDGSDVDFVALNGTVLGGTLMVKNEELWHLIQKDPKRLEMVLKEIGVPAEPVVSNKEYHL